MRKFVTAIVIALALAAPLATARAADNIACVDDGYTAEENARLDSFYREFRATSLSGQSLPPEVFAAVTRRTGDCAELHAWPAEAIEDATFYRLASIMKVALDRNTPLTPTQVRRLDEAISSVDQARLGRIINTMMETSLEGARTRPSGADTAFLGRLIIRAGIPATQPNGEYVGAYIGARIMREQARQRFASR